MTFGEAHRSLMAGNAVTRMTWPAGHWLVLIEPHETHPISKPFLALDRPSASPLGEKVHYTPSDDDLVARDWTVVE